MLTCSELLNLPAATGGCFARRYGDDANRVLIRCDFGFHASVIGPKPFHLMQLQLTSAEHHGEVRRVERLIRQTQLDALEAVPGDFTGPLAQLQMVCIRLFGLFMVPALRRPSA